MTHSLLKSNASDIYICWARINRGVLLLYVNPMLIFVPRSRESRRRETRSNSRKVSLYTKYRHKKYVNNCVDDIVVTMMRASQGGIAGRHHRGRQSVTMMRASQGGIAS